MLAQFQLIAVINGRQFVLRYQIGIFQCLKMIQRRKIIARLCSALLQLLLEGKSVWHYFPPYTSFKNGTSLIFRYFACFTYSLQITRIKLTPKLKQTESIDTLLLEISTAVMFYRLISIPVKFVHTKARRTSVL